MTCTLSNDFLDSVFPEELQIELQIPLFEAQASEVQWLFVALHALASGAQSFAVIEHVQP